MNDVGSGSIKTLDCAIRKLENLRKLLIVSSYVGSILGCLIVCKRSRIIKNVWYNYKMLRDIIPLKSISTENIQLSSVKEDTEP